MKTKQLEMKLEEMFKIPPTVPPVSWAEARADYKRGPCLSGPGDAAEYFRNFIGGKATESFLVMYVDHRNHVLDCVLMGDGTVDHTAVYPREVLKKALELNASGLLLSHNHPGEVLKHRKG